MKNGFFAIGTLALLGACATPVPDSGSGVGFSNYTQFEQDRARREAALTGANGPEFDVPQVVSSEQIRSEELAAAGIGQSQAGAAPLSALSGTAVVEGERVIGIEASPLNSEPELANNPGISDEQDFSAVSSRESIESDAQRRAAQAAAREEVQPTALPTRPSNTGPNIVAYALSAPNQKGQEWYSRSLLSGTSRFERNCAGYNTPDAAQRDFLTRGGPERDPMGIDPDGDGFACGWDPAPFRLVNNN
jgi:hypothetical protein